MTWKCPKCGREFARNEQDHYCIRPQTVEEYIGIQEEGVQGKLRELRQILREAIPEAEECIAWSMPTYRKGRNLIHFAAFRHHIGLYPGGEATTVFADELTGFQVSKGTIRLPYDRELPVQLIQAIARFCEKQYAKEAGRARRPKDQNG